MADIVYDWVAGYPAKRPEQLPAKEFTVGGLHIVDLTKTLDPGTESRRCRLWRFNTGGPPATWAPTASAPITTTRSGPAWPSCP